VRRELERRRKASRGILVKVARRGDARARAQARALLLRAERAAVVRRMIAFACSEHVELERGLLLISRFEEPRLDLRPYLLAIDAMAAEVLKRVEARRGLDGRAQVLSDYLGRELGYRGDSDDYHHPDNVYLPRAIVRKRGLPLTLTALYLLVARRARIRAAAIALPGHVLLRVYDSDERSAILDPFAGGTRLSERECLGYLAEYGLPFQPRWFDDADAGALWVRQIHNLHKSFGRRALDSQARALEPLLGVLARRADDTAGGARG